MANSLSRLVQDASQVFIMGHRYADLDAVGAAVGVRCIARRFHCPAKIVLDMDKNAVGPLLTMLHGEEEYKTAFISAQEALLEADSRTLLVVVDTNRPSRWRTNRCSPRAATGSRSSTTTGAPRPISKTPRSRSMSRTPRPRASSSRSSYRSCASPTDILPFEADAVLSGIVLDTKNFTIRTGDRTFDAAAFLRRSGADTTRVKKLFQNGMEETMERYDIMKQARIYKGIAVVAAQETQNRIVAAQAADELLNISGVNASAVLYPTGDGGVAVSARSIGNVNVQVLLETLGGGGNRSAAGAQIPNCSLRDAVNRLLRRHRRILRHRLI